MHKFVTGMRVHKYSGSRSYSKLKQPQPGKGGKKHVFYDLQMEVEAAKDDQVSDFFLPC